MQQWLRERALMLRYTYIACLTFSVQHDEWENLSWVVLLVCTQVKCSVRSGVSEIADYCVISKITAQSHTLKIKTCTRDSFLSLKQICNKCRTECNVNLRFYNCANCHVRIRGQSKNWVEMYDSHGSNTGMLHNCMNSLFFPSDGNASCVVVFSISLLYLWLCVS